MSQRKNSDLVISIKAAESYRDAGIQPSERDLKILSQKYSVHSSQNSKSNINAIKHTLTIETHGEVTTRNYTKALKEYKNYVALYAARSPDLLKERYRVAEAAKNFLLTDFNTKKSTLFYMVLVCSYDAPEVDYSDDYSFEYIDIFNKYRVLVLYAFINLPSHHTGLKTHFMTMDSEHVTADENILFERVERGYSSKEVCDVFIALAIQHKHELIDMIRKENPGIPSDELDFLAGLKITNEPIKT
ncbi:hypothetical protein [Zhongshania aliphaticivorans]|uniref:hypothetical protein n=1 Tax=Zhongshania aliphaticivorans TaxID=1470434 RepID=UPI0039C970C7